MRIPLVTTLATWPAYVRWGVLGALPVLIALFLFGFPDDGEPESVATARSYRMKVDRAISGHSIKLESDERVNYAGIRTPYKHEPFHEEARKRNAELIDGRTVRVRYDVRERDRKNRLLAYVSVDGQLVNETLVREGLAYVRLTPGTKRYSEKLLSAQADAQKRKRGIWRRTPKSPESKYPADPKYGNFHRPACEEVPKIKLDRLVFFGTRRRALDAGCAPCPKCKP